MQWSLFSVSNILPVSEAFCTSDTLNYNPGWDKEKTEVKNEEKKVCDQKSGKESGRSVVVIGTQKWVYNEILGVYMLT